MNLARFGREAQHLLASAHQRALEAGAARVAPEHLLLAVLGEESTGLPGALGELGVDTETLRQALARSTPRRSSGASVLDLSPELDAFLSEVWARVRGRQRHQVRPIDLIEALLTESIGSPSREKLLAVGAKPQDLQRAVTALKNRDSTPKDTAPKARTLRKFGRCLTDLAREDLLDPVIGRDQEIRRVMQVLCRRIKNNPVLIGKPGVGKTAIVEGLAQRIARGDVPAQLKSAAVFALDMAALVAGSEYRGVFEERMKSALDDIREAQGSIILFIDEVHTIVRGGAGGNAELSGILKPALTSGELRCIGVTTLDDYRNHIEKDGALERRFQPILVEEPTVDETTSILRGLRPRYEGHHDILITDEALVAAATLSHRFITERSLPDKAIDLVDEAASKVRIETEAVPVEVDAAGRRAQDLESELRDLASRRGAGQRSHQRVGDEAAALRQGVQRDRAAWQAQRTLAEQIRAGRSRLAWRRMVLSDTPRSGWTQPAIRKAARAAHQMEKELAQDEARLAELHRQRPLCKVDLDDQDIAYVVSAWTGIPISKLMENERAKLLLMETSLHRRIVGQDQAVRAVSNAVRLARAGMKDPNRPVGSFLFLGPTGVGKTELSRALAEFLFDDEAAMIRIDMSEYMEKHTVSRLVGAPPGYIGYEDSGQLTEAVRRRPYSVILFDEMEKAHPDVFNILLQMMDDGRLTDAHGRTIDFRNAILIMTSNVGGHLYREHLGKPGEKLQERLMEELRAHFRPEFLNRVDAIVRFDMLSLGQILQIVDIQTRLINLRMAGGDIQLEVSEPVKAYLAEAGYDILQGARPLKRLIQREILEPLALQVLQGKYREGDVVVLTMGDGKVRRIRLRRKARTAPRAAAPRA
ncbi:MAG: AAA family ATPase, partial [Dehalococcoidia bacterium]